MPQYRDEIKAIWNHSGHPLRELWDWAKQPDDPARRAERWDALAEWAGSHKRSAHDPDAEKDWKRKQRVYRKKAAANRQQAEPDVPGIVDGGWHPDARRVGVVNGFAPLRPGPNAGVLHTTEGFGVPTYNGTNPHFTLDVENGPLYQHQDVRFGARALANPAGGVETNIKCIQIENIAFAARASAWTEQMYDNLADLMRWIEVHCHVDRRFELPLAPSPGGPFRKFDATGWNQLAAWCGHQNVPENTHTDPGALDTKRLLA